MNTFDETDIFYESQISNQLTRTKSVDNDEYLNGINITEGDRHFMEAYARQAESGFKMDYKDIDPEDKKMAQILLEESSKFESSKFAKLPAVLQVNSPLVSTCESSGKSSEDKVSTQVSLMDYENPKETLNKRGFEEFNSGDSDAGSVYSPEEEIFEPKTRRGKGGLKPVRRLSEDSIASYNSKSTRASEKDEVNFSPAQGGQNKMKNHQGTFSSKIKQECKLDRFTNEETRLFSEVTQHLDEEKKEAFRKYASLYKKNDKTWKALIQYFKTELEFGLLFIKMILRFLSDDFRAEYDEFIRKGKMNGESKQLLAKQSSKHFFIEKFTLVFEEVQGKACNFEHSIKKSRKTL